MRTDDAMRREYTRRRPKKVAQRKDPLAVTRAPCCGRCEFWLPPEDAVQDPFGRCQQVVIVDRRVGEIEQGTLIARHERQRYDLRLALVSPMRTRSWAPACSLYHAKPDVGEADEPGIPEPTQRGLFEPEPGWAA